MAGALPDTPAARVDPNTPESPWSGVVAVRTGDGIFSGVVIAPRFVLTAAHVVGNNPPAKISVVLNASAQAQTIAAKRIEIFPGFSFPYDDLALIELAERVPDNVAIYPLHDFPLQVTKSVVSMVGYGASGNGDTGVSVGSNPNIKRVGENVVDALAARVDTSGRTSAFFLYDFDGPDGNGLLGGPSLGNARESVVAVGDSGSPVLVQETEGFWSVAGISTFASALNSGRALDYRFGQGGGGILIGEKRFLNWIMEHADGASFVSVPRAQSISVVPLAATVGAGAIVVLVVRMRRRN